MKTVCFWFYFCRNQQCFGADIRSPAFTAELRLDLSEITKSQTPKRNQRLIFHKPFEVVQFVARNCVIRRLFAKETLQHFLQNHREGFVLFSFADINIDTVHKGRTKSIDLLLAFTSRSVERLSKSDLPSFLLRLCLPSGPTNE